MPITATMEPPFGRWSARAELGFDVFDAPVPLAVLLAEPLVAVLLAACRDDISDEDNGNGKTPTVEDVEFVGYAS
jgi:hypothetical protein